MDNIKDKNQNKRKKRKKQTAEDFTPFWLIDQMLDKLEESSQDTFTNKEKTYIDPACGNGNMLVQVLKRKLKYANPVEAISTIYGCDIQKDNIQECRLRLLKVIVKNKGKIKKEDYIEIMRRLIQNIVWTPLEKYPKGSLDYLESNEEDNKTFSNHSSDEKCLNILRKIKEKNILSKVSI